MKTLPLFVLACLAGMSFGGAAPVVHAQALGPSGYTPTLYIFQKDKLVDVKIFKIADLQQCQRQASALLQLYLNHSDIEDDMSLAIKCVPVPPATLAHRKREEQT
jgi:hypothetical protein